MNVSIIIPNYNGEKLLKNNLPKIVDAVKEYKKGKIEIIIADDPSTDKSQHVIRDFIADLTEKNITAKTISNKNKNEAGFSKNVRRGVSLAMGDIIFLMNSDVIPHKNFLDPLIEYFDDPLVFAVGCMDESIENGKVVLRGRGIGKWQRGFLTHAAGVLDKENTLWVSGGSSAFRKKMWDKLKGLDVLYNPFYWEDIDLSYRALKAGYKICFAAKSVVIHEHEKGAIKTKYSSSKIQKIAYRNQFMFVWKNITDVSLVASHIFWLPYHLISALKRADWAFLSGFFMALSKFSQIRQSKEAAQKLFVVSDKKILKEHSE